VLSALIIDCDILELIELYVGFLELLILSVELS
jgi:hypothetical protein